MASPNPAPPVARGLRFRHHAPVHIRALPKAGGSSCTLQRERVPARLTHSKPRLVRKLDIRSVPSKGEVIERLWADIDDGRKLVLTECFKVSGQTDETNLDQLVPGIPVIVPLRRIYQFGKAFRLDSIDYVGRHSGSKEIQCIK